jgi:hypothetical protein
MFEKKSLAVIGITALALVFIVFLGVRHYGGNVSTLLHMDTDFGARHHVPSGLVLYQDGGYDGMLYFQVARDLPALFLGGHPSLNSPYRFQRILLPLLGYAVTLGHAQAFPMAFLIINLVAALGALGLMLSLTKKISVHTFTITFNPAILVGILFSLTEPVSLFFIVLFFWLRRRNGDVISVACIIALLLSLFARETTVFLIGLLFLWSLWQKRWKESILVLIPMALFVLWQYFLVIRLGAVAFQANGNIVVPPLVGPVSVLLWLTQGITTYRLSSVALMAFLFPLCGVLALEWRKKRTQVNILCFLMTGLAITMLCMHEHMWGVITSIGRVVTPFYPVYTLYAAERDTKSLRVLSLLLIALSVIAAIGIALVRHPFVIS